MASLDALFWAPNAVFHRRLQDGNCSKAMLEDHFEWLLSGVQRFKPSNEASRKLISEKTKVEIRSKAFAWDARHRPLALRAARLLDLDEVQAMLLLKRWLKDNEPDLKPEVLPDSDPVAMDELLLQVLRYYNQERTLLLKCLQVVMLKAGEADDAGRILADVLARLISASLEEQLHSRLRENLEGGAAAITRRLKAASSATAAPPASPPALGAAAAGAVATVSGAGGVTPTSLSWLTAAHSEMRSQLVTERLELLHCLLLLFEVCGVACKPERTQALARLLLDRVFVSVQIAGGGGIGGEGVGSLSQGAAEPHAIACQQLASLVLLSCLDLPGHVRVATSSGAATPGAPSSSDSSLPLGGKTMDVHNQLSQYAATPSSALLLLTWAGCLRLMDAAAPAAGSAAAGGSHMIRDLDGAARELEARVGGVGGLAAAAGAVAGLCAGAAGALLLVYRAVATKALCVLCTAFDLGVDTVDASTYEAVVQLLKLCVEGDAHACAALWDEASVTTAPLRALVAAAARLFPAVPSHLLRLLRIVTASADTARFAYAFLQRHVSLVVLHSVSEPAIRHLGGGEVELVASLPWNLAPSVPGLALPQGCVGSLCSMPAILSELRERYMLVAWDAEVSGGGGQSRGQVLLLGRATHCVAAVEQALLHNQPLCGSDPTLLRDLADTLSLLALLCSFEPGLVTDLMQQSVPFGAGTTRTWSDVVAGVLATGPQLHGRLAASGGGGGGGPQDASGSLVPSTLQLLADAAQLLAAVAGVAPGRVLALLPQLPLFSAPELLSGLPATVPLDALTAFQVPAGIEAFCGLLPVVASLQRDLEVPVGRFPLTVALMGLFAGLVERGFTAAPLPAAVLYVLHELLPGHHHWRYAAPCERWALTRAALRVLRVALTAGACVSDPDLSALAPALAGGAAGGSSSGASSGGGSVAEGGSQAALTADQLVAASRPQLHVSVLSAALLKLLLLHGGVLLARSLPPSAEALEALRTEDPSRQELPRIEECVGEVLQLVPPLLAAACVHPQEQPFEEFLLAGPEPTAAAHLASYIAYHEADQDATPPERQISYLALRALLSVAACAARPVSRSLPGVSLVLAVPSGSPAEACLRALLRGDAAASHPHHYALATQLAASAVGSHAKLLDALMFPCALEEELFPAQTAAAAAAGEQPFAAGGGGAAGAPAAGTQALAVATAARKPLRPPRQALDGLYATLQQAARLKREQPQVLCAALRLLAAMWQQPAAVARAVAVLRASKDLWPALEACLAPVAPHSGAAAAAATPPAGEAARQQSPEPQEAQEAASVEVTAHRCWCEALALQVLTAEAYARTRTATAPGGGASSTSPPATGPDALLDKLVREGLLLRLLRASAEAVPPPPPHVGAGGTSGAAKAAAAAVGGLQAAAAALYLEMGASAVAELWGPPGEPDAVALAPGVRQELAGVRALLAQGGASVSDIQAVHDQLLSAAVAPAGSPAEAPPQDDVLAPTHPLAALLRKQCLGATLVGRCHVAAGDLAQLPGGVFPPAPGAEHTLSWRRMVVLLGPAADKLQSADLLASGMCDLSYMASIAEARVAVLTAVGALVGVLAREGRLTQAQGGAGAAPSTPSIPGTPGLASGGSGSPGVVSGVLSPLQACCATAVSGLITWAADPGSRATQQPDWGLRRLHACHLTAALVTARLLLTSVQTARSAAGAQGTSAGGAASTPVKTPNMFAAPIALSPIVPRLGVRRAGGATPASSSTGVAQDAAFLPLVVRLAQQLAGWTRVVSSAGLPQCPTQVVLQVTDALGGALLLLLQLLQRDVAASGAEGAGDRQQLASSLLSMIPRLCELADCGAISSPLAAQLLLEWTRHLAPHDWLPLLLSNLDLGQHILAAAGRTGASASDAAVATADMGMLALAVAVAQVAEGARALHERGIFEQLTAAGRYMLSDAGGRLAAFSVIAVTGTGPYRPGVDGTYASTAGAGGGGGGRGLLGQAAADTCGAYLDGPATAGAGGAGHPGGAAAAAAQGAWAPAHRQWCTLLQFSAALLRTLGQHIDVEREALDLLLALEPRLMLAVLPPGSDSLQPLTLAGVVELEAALFLLCQLTPYLGGWHMVLPASLLNFRTAVSTLLTWLAQPTLAKSFAVDCRPRTPREAALAAAPAAGMPSTEGWLRVCTLGSAPPSEGGGGAQGGASTTSTLGTTLSLLRGPSESLGMSMSGAATPTASGVGPSTPNRASSIVTGALGMGAGGAAGGVAGGAPATEYSAQLAEKLYACAHHALAFLAATSPQLSEGEAPSLGPSWPRPRDLLALLEQCMAAAHALSGPAAPPASHVRRGHLARLLARVGQLSAQFLAVVGAPAGVGAREQHAREWLASLDLGGGGMGGMGSQAVPAI